MTDEQVQELLQELMREKSNYSNITISMILYGRVSQDDDLRHALCRYVINRMVPMRGKVPGVYKEPLR